jgi:hypothetical protein
MKTSSFECRYNMGLRDRRGTLRWVSGACELELELDSCRDVLFLHTLFEHDYILCGSFDLPATSMPAIIAPYYTLEDIDRAAVLSSGEGGETAVLRLLAQATTRDYASVCLPLTTDAWRARWHDMCVLSSVPGLGTDVGGPHVVRGTDGSDTGVGGINGAEERTRDQEQGTMSEEITGLRPDAGSNAAVVQKTNATRAEMWRTAPAFAREEVTVTRLGECDF